jgi:hypothetical protein
MKLRVLTCRRCGGKFEAGRANVLYCPGCRDAVQLDRLRAYHEARKKPVSKLRGASLCRRADCRFFDRNTQTCDYHLRMFEPRGCGIDGCVRYEREAAAPEDGGVFGELIFMDC